MIRLLKICTLALLFAVPLAAGDGPAVELYVGPSYLRIMEPEVHGFIQERERRGLSTAILSDQDLTGGQVGIAVNRWRHVSLVGTFGYHRGNLTKPRACCPWDLTSGVDNVYTYLGGVRLRQRLAGRLTVFVQGQAGGVSAGEANGLAIAAGSGLQVGLTRRLALEARVESLPLRLVSGWPDNNVQATVGVVVRFGGK